MPYFENRLHLEDIFSNIFELKVPYKSTIQRRSSLKRTRKCPCGIVQENLQIFEAGRSYPQTDASSVLFECHWRITIHTLSLFCTPTLWELYTQVHPLCGHTNLPFLRQILNKITWLELWILWTHWSTMTRRALHHYSAVFSIFTNPLPRLNWIIINPPAIFSHRKSIIKHPSHHVIAMSAHW